MLFSSNKFANAARRQAQSYERRFSRHAPFDEIVDTLRRQAAFDLPLKFVLDCDPESGLFAKRGVQWDFGNAGVRFEKREADGGHPTLVVRWSDEYAQATLQDILTELNALEFGEGASVAFELVSPEGTRLRSRYGNSIVVDESRTTIHFTGSWQEG